MTAGLISSIEAAVENLEPVKEFSVEKRLIPVLELGSIEFRKRPDVFIGFGNSGFLKSYISKLRAYFRASLSQSKAF